LFLPVRASVRLLRRVSGLSSDLSGPQPDQEIEKAPELLRCLRNLADKAGGDPPRPVRPDQKPIEELEVLTGNAPLAELHSRRDALLTDIKHWQDLGERIKDRTPAWRRLEDLLAHAKGLAPYQKLADEAQAIADQRALLAAHDPVQALLDKTVDLLRNSLNHHAQEHRDTLAREQAELDKDADWQRLNDAQRQSILSERHLTDAVSVDTATADSILAELERCSLSQWADRTQALRGRFEGARMDAARLLQPTVTHVDLPRRTLTTEEDLTAWLAEAEQRIRDKLKAGPVRV